MGTTTTMTLEEQIAALQAQINFMYNNQTRGVSPARRLQEVRRICRKKYFGSWEDEKGEWVHYGPEGKNYQDYDAIMDIIRKEAGLLYKYSRGKAMSGATITSLVQNEEDLKEYEGICEMICQELKAKIVQKSQRTAV